MSKIAKKKTEKKKHSARKRGAPASVHLELPATSANLGPAFDAAGLAMNLYIRIDARPASDFSIRATGRDPEIGGQALTPFLLAFMAEGTAGVSLTANLAAVRSNVELAARIAVAFSSAAVPNYQHREQT